MGIKARLSRWRYRLGLAGEAFPPGHFFSAIPDRKQVQATLSTGQRNILDVPGVDLALARQRKVLQQLEPLQQEMPFADKPVNGLRYGFDNNAFVYADGAFLHLMLRWLQPQRLIEVGSGYSSACTLDTVDGFFDQPCDVTFIEPYDELLRSLLRDSDSQRCHIITAPVQEVSLATFERLQDRDVLFIDSTHVSKVGSDVNFLLFEVLPRLRPGVVVHVHDIFPGFEYPWNWIEQGWVWQEDYLLRAFLQFNSEFEILLWPGLLNAVDGLEFTQRFPSAARNPGGSIYLRRRGGSDLGV